MHASDDLRRIRYVTEHYRQLQGLRLLPLSAPFLVSLLWRLAGPPVTPLLQPAGWGLLVAASLGASLAVGRYYTRRFGSAPPLWPVWGAGAATLLGAAAALLCLEWLQEWRPLPVSFPMLFLAIVFARVGLAGGRARVHYLWIAIACGAFALLAPLGAPLAVRAGAFDLLVGGSLIVAAIGDDRVLRRAIGPRLPA